MRGRVWIGLWLLEVALVGAADTVVITELPYPTQYSAPQVKGSTISPAVPLRFSTRAIGDGLQVGVDVPRLDAPRGVGSGLLDAAAKGDLAAVKRLVAEGADINGSDVRGVTALHVAANRGWIELVDYLLDQQAAVNAADREGRTPLMAAAVKGHAAVVALLLQRGADATLRDAAGWTARDYAVASQHKETIALFKPAGQAAVGRARE